MKSYRYVPSGAQPFKAIRVEAEDDRAALVSAKLRICEEHPTISNAVHIDQLQVMENGTWVYVV